MQDIKSPKPESLEAKFRLMTILPYDKRAKRKHILVFGFILDWYHSKYGDALASVRHVVATVKERDPFGVGLFTGDVHAALTDLVAWGYLTQEKGAGRRASRYIPVWEKAHSVQKSPNATVDSSSVRENPNTCVLENPNATADSIQKTPNEDPSTGPGHRTGSHVVGNEFSEPATPPLSAGLTATVAGSPEGEGDGFPEFWKVWPRKHGIKKARAEWKKILTDVDIIIEVAGDWAAHYKEHGVDKKWIPEPANWLKGERWLEDLPIVHIDAKGAAIAKAKANAPAKKPEPANDNVEGNSDDIPEFMKGSPSLWPVGEYWGEFVDNRIDNDCGDHSAWMTFLINTPGTHFGNELQHRFYLDCCIERYKNEGTQYLADICRAVGLSQVEDLDELMFKPLHVKADGNRLLYTKVAEAA
ncbi:hypothetical protein J2857_003127 [Neorhizobium galegae]|uniref:hypothetical protein n=1 Tax=Neorhizobium galegae TaxID=399 RepID=UPI001AE5D016|nr:hypothetical protein [Neorhizobium galegae]MBP2560358.1 hypothetical protein [Neorhizobium galegae]